MAIKEFSPKVFIDLIDEREDGLVRAMCRGCTVFYRYDLDDLNYCVRCGQELDDIEIRVGPPRDGRYRHGIPP